MESYSTHILSSWNWWLGWIAVIGTLLGLASMIGTLVIGSELSKRGSSRRLVESQKSAILSALNGAEAAHVEVWVAPNDREAYDFGMQIVELLVAARIIPNKSISSGDDGGQFPPLPESSAIEVRDAANPPPIADLIRSSFSKAGVDFPIRTDALRLDPSDECVKIAIKSVK